MQGVGREAWVLKQLVQRGGERPQSHLDAGCPGPLASDFILRSPFLIKEQYAMIVGLRLRVGNTELGLMVPSPGGRREARERCHWGSSDGGQVVSQRNHPDGLVKPSRQKPFLSDEVALELGL